jgi:hypothetical protein
MMTQPGRAGAKMASEVAARELVEEFGAGPRGLGASPIAWLGLGPSVAVRDRLAYGRGRSGKEVSEHVLKAVIANLSEEITHHIYDLKSAFARLQSQGSDKLAIMAYVVAIIFGLAVLGTALFVDYKIIHEFWARAVMDEFGKMPRSLASSVYFKSAQVIFATLAFHFMLEAVGETGRKVFVLFIFALTFTMLLGIGLIIANNWLPPGSQLFGVDLHAAARSGQDVLAALGLPSQAVAPTNGPLSVADVKTAQTMIWLGSLSLIFIIVTGVGSLCLRNAVHNFQKLSGAEMNDLASPGAGALRGSRRERLSELEVRLWRFGVVPDQGPPRRLKGGLSEARDEHGGNRAREIRARGELIRKHLLDFADSYAAGLHDYQTAFFGTFNAQREAKAKELLVGFGNTLDPLLHGYVQEYVEAHTVTMDDHDSQRPPARQSGGPRLVPKDDDRRSA